jgi:transketolase
VLVSFDLDDARILSVSAVDQANGGHAGLTIRHTTLEPELS